MTVPSTPSESGALLSQILDEFATARNQGQDPDIEDYTRKHPHLAEVIRTVFPAVLALDVSGDGGGGRSWADAARDGRLGDFRLIREVGRGGMGVVYEAEEIPLGRRVALKILPFAAMLDSRQLERFKNEARAAALLKHPHIVTVYSIGCDRGIHYFAMDFVDGWNLAQWIERHAWPAAESPTATAASDQDVQDGISPRYVPRRSTADAARARTVYETIVRLIIQAATALEHAHMNGVIHRDIKPSNLLIRRDGNLFISDFGLARIQSDAGLTFSGDVIGTLRYMSPEQLAGRLIDGRTDVYSLGLTLYELVVGQPAFGESSRESLMREILEVDPPAPRRIRAGVPRDLETIILKAIAKDRDRRYADASEFRDDLERFLDRRPIQARRMSRCGHFISWCRRRPATAVLTLSLASLLFLLSVAGPLLAVRYARLASLARRNLRIADLNRAYDAWYSGNVDETERLLRRHISQDTAPHRTDFALQYLAARLAESQQTVIFRHEKPVTALAVSADGRMVASARNGGLICLTDIVTQQLIHLTAPVSHVSDLAFSPDGQWLLAGGAPDSLVLWDVPAWQPRMIRTPTRVNVGCIAFAPNGPTLAAGLADGRIGVWSTSGERRWIAAAHSGSVRRVAFDPAGRSIVSASANDGTVKVFDAVTGQPTSQLQMSMSCAPFGVTFAGDGGPVVTFGRLGAQFWDPTTGHELMGLREFTKPISAVAVSRGGLLATGGYDHLIMVWDLSTGRRLMRLPAHRRTVTSLAFESSGHYLISASDDGTVRRFDMDPVRLLQERLGNISLDRAASVDLSPDGRSLVSVAAAGQTSETLQRDGGLTTWDPASGKPRFTLPIAPTDGERVAISPDGSTAATCGTHGVKLWDLRTRRLIGSLDDDPAHAVDISADGCWLAVLGMGGEPGQDTLGHLRIWSLNNLQCEVAQELGTVNREHGDVAFSQDSRSLAVGYGMWPRSAVDVWTMKSGRWQQTQPAIIAYPSVVTSVRFYAQDRQLLSSCFDGSFGLWDFEHAQWTWLSQFQSQKAFCAAITEDGRTIATGGDREIRLWDVDSNELLATLEVYIWVSSLAFTPDGRTLIWGSGDGNVNFERAVLTHP